MNLDELWEKALNNTQILRSRLSNLFTFEATQLPYIFLAESSVNLGDTVLRKGKVYADKPLIILPKNFPQFEGFKFKEDFATDQEQVRTFLLMRGMNLPSLKYSNLTYKLDIYEGTLNKATDELSKELEKKEDVHTGLITGPEEAWQFSIIIYVSTLAAKSMSSDIINLFNKYRKKK